MKATDPFSRPASSKVSASFALGILIGVIIVFPAFRNSLGLVTVGDAGAIGRVLVIGVLSIACVSVGLVGLYQFFILVDK